MKSHVPDPIADCLKGGFKRMFILAEANVFVRISFLMERAVQPYTDPRQGE